MAALNNKFDMFQTTAVKGVIDALTGENLTLATKYELNKKLTIYTQPRTALDN